MTVEATAKRSEPGACLDRAVYQRKHVETKGAEKVNFQLPGE
jgi:hypothetical protein